MKLNNLLYKKKTFSLEENDVETTGMLYVEEYFSKQEWLHNMKEKKFFNDLLKGGILISTIDRVDVVVVHDEQITTKLKVIE